MRRHEASSDHVVWARSRSLRRGPNRVCSLMPAPSLAAELAKAARELSRALDRLRIRRPVTHVYNPLDYAWQAHERYLHQYGASRKRVVFLGMNPGPFGMVQTGVPFGEVNAVRNWLKIEAPIGKPRLEHPKRPVEGFASKRSEVSGRRLWGLFADRFGSARNFFADHFVVNYCPLAFFDMSGHNLTPDKLAAAQSAALFVACDCHLARVVEILQPQWLIGVGDFAQKRARLVVPEIPAGVGRSVQFGKILHPSPASPAANKDWAGKATAQMKALGLWK